MSSVKGPSPTLLEQLSALQQNQVGISLDQVAETIKEGGKPDGAKTPKGAGKTAPLDAAQEIQQAREAMASLQAGAAGATGGLTASTGTATGAGMAALGQLAGNMGSIAGEVAMHGDCDITCTATTLGAPKLAQLAEAMPKIGEIMATENTWAQSQVLSVIKADFVTTQTEAGEALKGLLGSSSAGFTVIENVVNLSPELVAAIKDQGLLELDPNLLKKLGDLASGKTTTSTGQAYNASIVDAAASHKVPPGLESRWGQFVAGLALTGGVDINALVQQVLRESYMETTKDLYYYAEKVKFYNNLKKEIRAETKAMREIRAGGAGEPDDGKVPEAPIKPKTFDDTFNPELDKEEAAITKTPEEIAQEQEDAATEAALAAAITQYEQDVANADPTGETTATSGTTGNKGNWTNAENEFKRQLQAEWEKVKDDPIKREAFIKELTEKGITVSGAGKEEDGWLKGADDPFSYSKTFKYDAKTESVEQFMARIADDVIAETKVDFHDQSGSADLKHVAFSYSMPGGVGYVDPKDVPMPQEMIDAGYTAGGVPPGETSSTSEAWEAGDNIDTWADLDAYIENLEEDLQQVGDDAQLANVDLQNMLQKQQQTMQMMSNISKQLHDTALAIIRKIGG